METKKDIRKKVFARRKEHTDTQILEMSREICRKVTELEVFRQAKAIYAYADYNHEVMTGGIIEAAWKAGKQVAVPKVVGKDMIYYELTDFSQLEPGYYNIPEPVGKTAADWEDALMIMPGVAFDTDRHRVGYGGGFYDRFLEVHTGHPTLALAFEFQIMKQVPVEPTDIRPQIIVTEKRLFL